MPEKTTDRNEKLMELLKAIGKLGYVITEVKIIQGNDVSTSFSVSLLLKA